MRKSTFYICEKDADQLRGIIFEYWLTIKKPSAQNNLEYRISIQRKWKGSTVAPVLVATSTY